MDGRAFGDASSVSTKGSIQPTVRAGFGGRFLALWCNGGELNCRVYESPNYDPNGGSVNPENAAEIIAGDEVNGALVGGASLSAESFMNIVLAAQDVVASQS